MALIAGELITEARDIHPAFDPARHPDLVLVRCLSRLQQQLVSRALEANAEALATPLTINFPLADFEAGVTLPEHHYVHAPGTVHFTNGVTTELHLVPWAHRHDPIPFYSAFHLEDKLYFRGSAAVWSDVVKVVIHYAPVPAPLTSINGAGGTLILPESARDALVAGLAAFMASRTPAQIDGLPPVPMEKLQVDYQDAVNRWVTEIGRRRQAHTFLVRDVT